MVTYTLAKTAVAPVRRVDGASEEAKLMAEIFERLLELESIRFRASADMVNRLATLAQLSERAYVMCLRFGSGDTAAILASYEEQVRKRELTRQAVHWQWGEDIRAIRFGFPELAEVLLEYRDTVKHREDGMSAADGLRAAMDRGDGPE